MDPVVAIFGEAFFEYVLAQDVVPPSKRGFSARQRSVHRALTRLALQVQNEQPLVQRISLMNAVLVYVEDKHTTLANSWRFECIGDSPVGHDLDDPVLASLLALAHDTYPGLLLPRSSYDLSLFEVSISGSIYRHPAWMTFCRAVLADEHLRRLFPGVDSSIELSDSEQIFGIESILTLSVGRSGRFQLALFAATLLMAAYHRYLIMNEPRTVALYAHLREPGGG